MNRSEGLMGLASMRTRTCPLPHTGGGTSRTCRTCSGSPQRSQTTAFTRSDPGVLAELVEGVGLGGQDDPALKSIKCVSRLDLRLDFSRERAEPCLENFKDVLFLA